MRQYFGVMFVCLLVVMGLAACRPAPPTVVYIVISPTPEGNSVSPEPLTGGAQSQSAATATAVPTEIIATNTPLPTPTPDLFPTQTIAQVQVAEQVYEGGRMMWVQPVNQIWVMIVDEEGKGRWLRYEDTFVEGDPEIDTSIVAPEGKIQPERGFGKLWRTNPEVRDALGWAITPEFGYISQYEYHPGGHVENQTYIPGYGYHKLFSLNSEAFKFDEESSTWMLE